MVALISYFLFSSISILFYPFQPFSATIILVNFFEVKKYISSGTILMIALIKGCFFII